MGSGQLLAAFTILASADAKPATGAVEPTKQPAHRSSGADRERGVERRSMISRHRTDPIRLTKENRICVKTTADPLAQAVIDVSGERMGSSDLQSLSYETAGAISESLHAHAHPTYFRNINGGLEQRVLTTACDGPASIRIEQTLLRGTTTSGYRIRFSVRQETRAYVTEIQRPRAVSIHDSERAALGEHATRRFDGSPFWSARGDLVALRNDFIEHLLAGNVK